MPPLQLGKKYKYFFQVKKVVIQIIHRIVVKAVKVTGTVDMFWNPLPQWAMGEERRVEKRIRKEKSSGGK